MPTLTTYRLLGIHLIGLLSGIYVAAWIAHFFGWFWPGSRLPAFIIVSLFFACSEVSMTIRELRRGRLSTGLIILDYMPFLLLGGGVSLILGWLATRWFGSDTGGLVVFIGVLLLHAPGNRRGEILGSGPELGRGFKEVAGEYLFCSSAHHY